MLAPHLVLHHGCLDRPRTRSSILVGQLLLSSVFALAALPAQGLTATPSVALGDPLQMRLSGVAPGTLYWLDATFFGTSPGVVWPGSYQRLPANRPWMFADLAPSLDPSTFIGCLGIADANGSAMATLHVDELPLLAGARLHAFGATLDPSSPAGLGRTFGPVPVNIIDPDVEPWTTFTPSLDSRVIYVSNAGDDRNSGLSPSAPVCTVARGKALVRHGYPDWLLFRRGDVWNSPIGAWTACGRSAEEPILIGSYGSVGARPLFRTGGASGITFTGGGSAPPTMDHVALVGLEFYADARDPASPTFVGPGQWPARGVQYLRPGQNLHIEDCLFRMFSSNIVVEGEGAGMRNLVIRRCVLADAYGLNGVYYGHGIYLYNVHGARIEENVIDRNGWDNGPGQLATIFTHNVYIQQLNSNISLRRNIIARGGSHGVQLRCGGSIVENVFVCNAISALIGGDVGTTSTANEVLGNVILCGTDISPTSLRGWGIEASHLPAVTIRGNLIAQCLGGMPVGIRFTTIASANVVENTLVQWNGGSLQQTYTLPGFVIERNILSQSPSFTSNRLASTVPFADGTRSLAAFHAQLGGNGSLDGFLGQARRQSRSRWLPAYTAQAAAAWVRQGFRPTVDLGSPQVGAVAYR